MEQLANAIRNIPDFPKDGIQFKDITPLLQQPALLKQAIRALIKPFVNTPINAIAAMEARGFIIGSLAAWELGVGFVPLRKPGKLPAKVATIAYDLEYGSAALEIHVDALKPRDRVLLVDDLIATGGTAAASCQLIEQLGAVVVACAFLVELDFLKGREQLAPYPIHSVLHY